MGAVSCAIKGVYKMLCRDDDYANGGLNPSEKVIHADGFIAEKTKDLEELDLIGIDRKIQVVYNGQNEMLAFVSGNGSQLQESFGVTVRVGYATGNHLYDSYAIIGDDALEIKKRLIQKKFWPACISGCVQKYSVLRSWTDRLDESRTVLNIDVEVTVYG